MIYAGIQIRGSNRVNQDIARHNISDFVLQISMFDEEHAETYYRHYELGLMPVGHWQGYARYVEGYSTSPGFVDF